MPAYVGVLIGSANTSTEIFHNTTQGDITLNVNASNQNDAAATIKLHLTDGTTYTTAVAANNIEPGRVIDARGVFERWAITVGPTQKLFAYSDTTNVSFVPFGSP